MKAFLDSSVLVAAFVEHHDHHEASLDLFLRHDSSNAACSAHSLAEVYSTITGTPGKDRVSGDEALLFLGEICQRLTLIALNPDEVLHAIEASASNIAGAAIYDSLIGHCALKAQAEVLYTWNLRDFQRLRPEIATLVQTP
jgi:predicted nucleic acid-binding protein